MAYEWEQLTDANQPILDESDSLWKNQRSMDFNGDRYLLSKNADHPLLLGSGSKPCTIYIATELQSGTSWTAIMKATNSGNLCEFTIGMNFLATTLTLYIQCWDTDHDNNDTVYSSSITHTGLLPMRAYLCFRTNGSYGYLYYNNMATAVCTAPTFFNDAGHTLPLTYDQMAFGADPADSFHWEGKAAGCWFCDEDHTVEADRQWMLDWMIQRYGEP